MATWRGTGTKPGGSCRTDRRITSTWCLVGAETSNRTLPGTSKPRENKPCDLGCSESPKYGERYPTSSPTPMDRHVFFRSRSQLWLLLDAGPGVRNRDDEPVEPGPPHAPGRVETPGGIIRPGAPGADDKQQ